MEVLILTCLLTIIILLLKDKLVINTIIKNPASVSKESSKDILGKSKFEGRLLMPNSSIDGQFREEQQKENNFEMTTEGKASEHSIPEKNSMESSQVDIDYEEEEEEFKTIGLPKTNRGYAKGVSFQELNEAGQIFGKDDSDSASKRKAMNLVHKIDGTDLFYLLETAMPGSSRKIADLLNKNLPEEVKPKTSRNSDDFDIGEFI